ncbi:hypothetical protein [Streptomyces sp. NPDC046887]|uniref:hypothetical protein n=1 Tax=Streptomyces sp. NPDC046887 TaxID=3155472 RepID=UPI0033F7E9DB
MTEETHSITEARDRLDELDLQEARALAAYRARQARGEDAGVPQEEAYRRVFGDGA